jgi:hypothetical protein
MLKKIVAVLATLWAAAGLIAGAVLGVYMYRHINHPFYFLLPFVLLGGLGVVPSSLLLLLLRAKTWRARLATVAVYGVAIALAVGGPAAWRNYYETPRNGGPYLVWSDDPRTSLTVCWTAEQSAPGRIEYAPEASAEWKPAECPATHYPKVKIAGLQPGAKYRYRVPALGGQEHPFQTAPAVPEDFSFAVYGDNRHAGGFSWHSSVMREMVREDGREHFRLILNSGDIVERPGKGYGWQWATFLRDITPLAASRPYEVSLGNHESGGDPPPFEDYFDYGHKEHWRTLDYAGVRFITVSTQDDIKPGSAQYSWLEQALDQKPADNRFTVVTMHKPLLTRDPRGKYNDPVMRGELEPLFAAKGVDIVFAGHVHAYEHHHLPSFEHVITGGGGVLLWAKPTPGPDTVKTETVWHFCAVNVKGKTMSVRALRTDGSVIEAFEVQSKR